jgi:hypothetical protein
VLPLILLDGGVPFGQVLLRDQVLVLLRDEQAVMDDDYTSRSAPIRNPSARAGDDD